MPFSVRMAAAGPMISHRGEEWSDLLEEVKGRLGRLLDVEEPVVLLPGSGTGALEALAANLLAPGDEVISFSCGTFGDRFREIVSRRGAKVIALDAPRGEGFRRGHIREALEKHPGADALLFTHHETSTGVVNPLEELLSEIPADGPLVLVDAVSSLGAMPCRPSHWGIDGLASCSQKGLLAPPGLALVHLSERGWERAAKGFCPSYFFDLALHRRFLKKGRPQNPFTPPVSVFYGLAESLRLLEGFGWDAWARRTRRKARSFEAACEAMGFELFVREKEFRSPVMTALEAVSYTHLDVYKRQVLAISREGPDRESVRENIKSAPRRVRLLAYSGRRIPSPWTKAKLPWRVPTISDADRGGGPLEDARIFPASKITPRGSPPLPPPARATIIPPITAPCFSLIASANSWMPGAGRKSAGGRAATDACSRPRVARCFPALRMYSSASSAPNWAAPRKKLLQEGMAG